MSADSSSDRASWQPLAPPLGPLQFRPRGALCTDPRDLAASSLGLYREGSLRAVVQVVGVEVDPDRVAWLTLRILAQAARPGRPPPPVREVLQVSARLPDGMHLIWRLWPLTAETTTQALFEAVERRLVPADWSWCSPRAPA